MLFFFFRTSNVQLYADVPLRETTRYSYTTETVAVSAGEPQSSVEETV